MSLNNSLSDLINAGNEKNSSETTQESSEILNIKSNDSLINQKSETSLQELENDINDKINANIAVNQLTGLTGDAINNKPQSVDTIGSANDIAAPDFSLTTGAIVSVVPKEIANNSDNIAAKGLDGYNNQTNQSMISSPVVSENKTETTTNLIHTEEMGLSMGISSYGSHRNKRSFLLRPLRSNLDEILNMRRQRRATMRFKRNSNYEDLLASILAPDDDNDNAVDDKYGTEDANEALNTIALNYILSDINSDNTDDNNKYSDLERIKQYYDYILPLIENADSSNAGDSDTTDDNSVVVDDLPNVYGGGYSQASIPVIPYSWPNRYQRIRRSYYNRYQNPLSVYTGLKRKRSYYKNHMRGGEWGKIVGANSDRSAYDDEAQEANKIYSLASLLATDYAPVVDGAYGQRFKRSAKRLAKQFKRSVKPDFKHM
ncbi:unnamed protein product [Medioppia subpectinata]|uniref:Uncharacterized protein n=1 Tax=Medioppia subpectinata TaxID=1979941 RepID=A0A7R9Q4P9_9ACAR|nr:unnamed protein product [Medioppia subpectinata]CAG2112509.1 unnamed protein product [Medioppia subpectinata]